MIKFDFDESNDVSESKQMLTCEIHGEYPASLKSYGCPDCVEEDFDDDLHDDWKDRQARKGLMKGRD